MNKRNEQTMLDLILKVAKNDEGIRAVIMNGSRASPGALKDNFQDYDIIYIVNNIEVYVENRQWLKQFGELILMQTSEEMDGIWPRSKDLFGFLMLFTDGNRIDLRLMQYDKFISMGRDSQSKLLLDKDSKIGEFEAPSDKDYLPSQPTEKELNDCCNEFLWVSTNVAKGISRKQLTYAKFMSEQVVKDQLIKLLIWYAGIQTHFQKSMGAHAKYLEHYLEPEIWNKFRETYVNADYENIWKGIFIMYDIFNDIALKIARHFNYQFDAAELQRIKAYLQKIKHDNET